jgi:hypothetical protein
VSFKNVCVKPRFFLGMCLSALVILLSSIRGFAQGCDQGILDYTVTCDSQPDGLVHASRCSNFGGGGDPCDYCYLSYGDCTQLDGSSVPYTLANFRFQGSCPNCNQVPTCCNGGKICGLRYECGTSCTCEFVSPIIIDTTGKGFHLTSADDGVLFDIAGEGRLIKIAWTAAGSGNAFLALDRNHDGKIDRGQELFGNFTPQPKSEDPNGFLALAEFDKPENGGNGDGIIDGHDSVFNDLLLWIDENHDGISQLNELHKLPELGVFSLSLRYRDDRHFYDQFENWFHYQSAVNPDARDGSSKDGRIAYDVFFVVSDNARTGNVTALQSRVPEHLARPDVSRDRLTYEDRILYDGIVMASFGTMKTRCRPRQVQLAQEVRK